MMGCICIDCCRIFQSFSRKLNFKTLINLSKVSGFDPDVYEENILANHTQFIAMEFPRVGRCKQKHPGKFQEVEGIML